MSLSMLTPDAGTLLYSDDPPAGGGDFAPTVQVLNIRKMANNVQMGADRYRLVLSDGSYFFQSMLATQLNSHIEDESISKNTLLRLDNFAMNVVGERKIVIVLAVTVVQQGADKLGSPVNIETNPPAPAAPAVAPTITAKVEPNAGASVPAARVAAPVSKGGFNKGKTGGNKPSISGPLYPIEGLSPYQNKWTIKARVTNKSEIKHWSNARGEGKLFSVTLMDETGEIKATGFNDAVDRFHSLFEEGKVYFVSKARVNIAKKQFSNVNNEYEITFENGTEVELCEDGGGVPQIKFNFVELSELESLEKDSVCDVIGIVNKVDDLVSITAKATQKLVSKRDITIVDKSEFQVRLTLWGKTAENFEASGEPIYAFKGVKVGDFGGRTLSVSMSSTMSLNPDIPEAHLLRGWYDSQSNKSFKTHANTSGSSGGATGRKDSMKTIVQLKDEMIGMSDKMEYFTTKATITYIKSENLYYPACPAEGCNKKVTEEGDQWRCEKCDKSYPAPQYRYIVNMSVADYTGQAWFTGFNEIGEALIGKSANEMFELKEQDESEYNAVLLKAQGRSYNFNCSAKQDTFNDTTRVRYGIKSAGALNFAQETQALMEKIKLFGI